MRRWKTTSIVSVVVLVVGAAGPASAQTPKYGRWPQLISVTSEGTQTSWYSQAPAISWNGRYVAFTAAADGVVSGDDNQRGDAFVRDTWSNTTTIVSVSSTAAQANGNGVSTPGMSADGRYVVFVTDASNLVPGDTNDTADVFLRDRWTSTTTRVSVATDGSQADSASLWPDLSPSGRYLTFISSAENLVPDDTNNQPDVFVRDLRAGAISRVNLSTTGEETVGPSTSPHISADGRYVTFSADAANLVPDLTHVSWHVYVRDRVAGTTRLVSVGANGELSARESIGNDISGTGRYVAFASEAPNLVPGDTNNAADIFLRDLVGGTIRRISVSNAGSQADASSYGAEISVDGRYVLYISRASNLVPSDTNSVMDLFIYDVRTRTTRRVNVERHGEQANGDSGSFVISPDNRRIAFTSGASNLVPGDTNDNSDVFLTATRPAAR